GGDGVDDTHLDVAVPVGGVTLVKMRHESDSERSGIRERKRATAFSRGLRAFWGLDRRTLYRRRGFQTFKSPKAGGLRNNTADGSPSLEPQ
ncbi:MAG: hypothetical protein O3A31_12085, partial [Planctomycetota bacterium]|nr:hypothetical protein [Planctomycetota bacterium]